MLAFAIFAVTFVVVLIFVVVYLYPGASKSTTVPGLDPSDVKDGNLGDIAKAGSLHEFLLELHDKFGEIASFWWGQELIVSVGSPKLFKETSQLFDRPNSLFMLFEPLIGSESIQFANGGDGRKRRALYDRCFSHEAVTSYFPAINKIADELIKKWKTVPAEEHIAIRHYMFDIAIKAISKLAFGIYFDDDKKIAKLRQSYDLCWHYMEDQIKGSVPDAESTKRFEKAKEDMRSTMKEAIEACKKRGAGDNKTFLIDVMVKSDLPESVIISDCVTYFVAAFHTTGLLMTWAIYFLATHQDIQDKVVEELRDIMEDEPANMAVQSDLVYLRQVVDETLRCSTLAPFVARCQDYDVTLAGHKIPAKTAIVQPLGVMLQNPEIFPEPEKFDPDRFSPENRKNLPNFAFEPFGFAGKRKCPGYRFSYAEATVFLSALLRKFKFSMVPGQVVVPEYGLVTNPKEEIWVTIEKRK